jgi:tRNA threonylcarbamoyladenosine biosynthesis protein TsaE
MPATIHITKNSKQTQKLGENLAKEMLKSQLSNTATVLGLKGDIGGGKTTFLQGFAKGIGIEEKITSPTFVIMKRFNLPVKNKFRNFYHIDCYRLKNEKDILELNFKNIILNPENIIAIEWPERIKKILTKYAVFIKFDFIEENKRKIKIDKQT